MKKIAFFVQWMLCGGVENALIALSNELVNAGNDVTIYVIKEKGDFLKKIPNSVHLKVIPMDTSLRKNIPVGGTKVTVRECFEEHKYLNAFRFAVKHKLNKNEFAELNVNLNKIPNLKEQYDIAVNFHIHSPFLVWYVSEKVAAEKKYAWIHNDFETTQYDIRALKKYLLCIEHFFAVSDQVKEEFSKKLPEFSHRVSTALNIIPTKELIEMAEEYWPKEYTTKKLKLLTVGRLEEQKGYNIAIDVCEKMKEQGMEFDWFILGDGTQREILQNEIKRRKLNEWIHLLGAQMNPYPYFRNCDIYVQTSIHEGYGIALAEARLFNRPIVTTDFAGAREQIVDKKTGRIVKINSQPVYEALIEVMRNEKMRKEYVENLRKVPFSQDLKYLKEYF